MPFHHNEASRRLSADGESPFYFRDRKKPVDDLGACFRRGSLLFSRSVLHLNRNYGLIVKSLDPGRMFGDGLEK